MNYVVRLDNEIFESYLTCRYKAFLKQENASGKKSDYEIMQQELMSKYKEYASRQLLFCCRNSSVLRKPISAIEALQKGTKFIFDTLLEADNIDSRYDALEKVIGKSDIGSFHYAPILFSEKEKISKENKMMLAFQGFVIGNIQNRTPQYGKIIHGQRFKTVKVNLQRIIPSIKRLTNEISNFISDGNPPKLMLNSHCKICEFKDSCRNKAVEKDDLSLLAGISEKDIKKLNGRGIFTVTQYSYSFRPRRKRISMRNIRRPHFFDLKALALRENKIYIYEKPELPTAKTHIYIDIEGDPDRGFNYLIGILVVEDGSEEKSYSFWADNETEEEYIFGQFLAVIRNYPVFRLFYYGSYEKKFLIRMSCKSAHHNFELIQKVVKNSLNILSSFYSNIYFPTYSNELKDIGSYMGFKWTEEDASGIQSIVWRRKWETSRNDEHKQKLIQYNIEDCLALRKVVDFVYKISSNSPEADNNLKPEFVSHHGLKTQTGRRLLGHTKFPFPDLDYINQCAYFNYQRDKIFIRTNRNVQEIRRRKKKKKIFYTRINEYVEFKAPFKCPLCGCKTLSKAGRFYRITIDLKFFRNGMKKWVTKYLIRYYRCFVCHKLITPKKYQGINSKYGHNLVSWVVYQNMANGMSFDQIDKTLNDIFELPIGADNLYRFKYETAEYYHKTYQKLLNNIVKGNIIHADETKINLRDESGYVWVFTTMEEVAYVYTKTREGDFLKGLLKGFGGVLISDFYAAYDSIECPQQKCLIHLIRDLNDDLFKNQFDEELKEMIQQFTVLLREIIGTIDKYGLKRRNLNKHKKGVRKFIRIVANKAYISELAQKYQKRFLKTQNKLFTFLDYDGVPWNNNNAEHGIKQFALFRNRREGLFTQSRINDFLILLSIYQTCKYKGINFLNFLLSKEKDVDKYAHVAGLSA